MAGRTRRRSDGGRASAAAVVADVIRRHLREERRAGERLPSEPTMARALGISRVTLREALHMLEAEQLIVRRHGVGTFVTDPPVRNSLHLNFGVEHLIRSMGRQPSTPRIRWARILADEATATALRIEPRALVWVLERVRASAGRPVVHSFDHVPAGVGDGRRPPAEGSLYAYLETLGLGVVVGDAELRPSRADGRTATALGVPEGTLCLTIEQVDYEAGGLPVLYSVEHHLADAFRFRVQRQGPATS